MRKAALLVLFALSPCLLVPPAVRAQAQAGDEIAVSPAAGPWMICVASYTGPDAPELARQMAVALHSRDQLKAYVFNRANEERRQLQEELDRWMEQHPGARPKKIRPVEEQCAVLIGGYRDIDAARNDLDRIKKLKPPELHLDNGKTTTDYMFQMVPRTEGQKGYEVRRAPVNPFAGAFVAPNPTVPREHLADNSRENAFLKELNRGRPYNLLDCKHPWTVVVKDFSGAAIAQPQSSSGSFLSMLGLSGNQGDVLDAGGKQAEEVARVLRQMGFEAYVLHTRHNSLVTVGAYDSPEDPRIEQVQRQLRKLKLGTIEFYDNPVPRPVPQL